MIGLLCVAALIGGYVVLRAITWLIVLALAEPMGDAPCDK